MKYWRQILIAETFQLKWLEKVQNDKVQVMSLYPKGNLNCNPVAFMTMLPNGVDLVIPLIAYVI